MTITSRIKRIEKQLGITGDDELVEIPWPDGRIHRTTRRKLNEFLDWLKGREDNGQETIEMNETGRN